MNLPKERASERLAKAFSHNLTWISQTPKEPAVFIFLYYSATHDPRMRKIYTSILEQTRRKYLKNIYARIREGDFKLNLKPEVVAEMLHDFIVGSLINLIAA